MESTTTRAGTPPRSSSTSRARRNGWVFWHPTRRSPGGEAWVCNLVEPLGLSQPAVTHHPQVLHRAGLLVREKRGVWVYFRVVREALDALRRALG